MPNSCTDDRKASPEMMADANAKYGHTPSPEPEKWAAANLRRVLETPSPPTAEDWQLARQALERLDARSPEPEKAAVGVEAKPVAWMRRWAADGMNVMSMKKGQRPNGWSLHEVSVGRILEDDVALVPASALSSLHARIAELERENDVLDTKLCQALDFAADHDERATRAEAIAAEAVMVVYSLLDHIDRETCTHEDTVRGGFLWTICQGCGAKWADDEVGFVPHEDAAAVAAARAFIIQTQENRT